MADPGVQIVNKKARFNYEVLDTVEAGIVLSGSEVKSVRARKVNFQDAYCYFKKSELFCKGIHIAEYEAGGHWNHVPDRERKLLLKKKELRRLRERVREKGITLVPLKLYINRRGWVKVLVGLVRGKKKYDKRETIKRREQERESRRALKDWR